MTMGVTASGRQGQASWPLRPPEGQWVYGRLALLSQPCAHWDACPCGLLSAARALAPRGWGHLCSGLRGICWGMSAGRGSGPTHDCGTYVVAGEVHFRETWHWSTERHPCVLERLGKEQLGLRGHWLPHTGLLTWQVQRSREQVLPGPDALPSPPLLPPTPRGRLAMGSSLCCPRPSGVKLPGLTLPAGGPVNPLSWGPLTPPPVWGQDTQ